MRRPRRGLLLQVQEWFWWIARGAREQPRKTWVVEAERPAFCMDASSETLVRDSTNIVVVRGCQ